MDMPQNYKTAGTLMLVAGIYNVMMSLIAFAILAIYVGTLVLATFGFGLPFVVCCAIPIPGLVFGGVEIYEGLQIMNGKVVKSAPTLSIVGIVIAAMTFAMVPLVLEIIATTMLRNDDVKAWLEANDPDRIGG